MGSAISTIHTVFGSGKRKGNSKLDRDDFIWSYTIGSGAFSKVCSVNHIASKQWMAMKKCNIAEYRKHNSGLKLIENELLILSYIENSSVQHPNINRFHFAFHDKISLYMAFDLKTCGDLRLHLQHRKTALDETSVAFIAICISDALTHLHARGILHRDVKPENILIDDEGFPYLTDFGVSYLDEQAGRELECTLGSGTREYLAPEVLSKSRCHGAEADFWSLGVMLFELLFRTRPFENRCPTHFVKLVNYFHQHDVYLTSTGSKYAPTSEHENSSVTPQRRPQLDPPLAVAATTISTLSSTASTCAASFYFSPSSSLPTRSEADYQFSITAHHAYVANAVTNNRDLSFKLNDMKFQAYKERDPKGLSMSTPPPPPGSNDSNTTDHSQHPEKTSSPLCVSDFLLELPASLRVTIAHPHPSEYARGTMPPPTASEDAADVLGRMLDPRVWWRLGGGANYQPLQRHTWFSAHGLCWESVISRKYASPIRINKEKLDVYFQCKRLYEEESYDDLEIPFPPLMKKKPLSAQEKKILDDFYYISPSHCATTSSSSEDASSNTSKGGGDKQKQEVQEEEEEEEEEQEKTKKKKNETAAGEGGGSRKRNIQKLVNINKNNKVFPTAAAAAAEEVDTYNGEADDHDRKFSLKSINRLLSKHKEIDFASFGQ